LNRSNTGFNFAAPTMHDLGHFIADDTSTRTLHKRARANVVFHYNGTRYIERINRL